MSFSSTESVRQRAPGTLWACRTAEISLARGASPVQRCAGVEWTCLTQRAPDGRDRGPDARLPQAVQTSCRTISAGHCQPPAEFTKCSAKPLAANTTKSPGTQRKRLLGGNISADGTAPVNSDEGVAEPASTTCECQSASSLELQLSVQSESSLQSSPPLASSGSSSSGYTSSLSQRAEECHVAG